jgi:DNA replication and repair protein RecF
VLLKKIELINFRNYNKETFNPDNNLNLITGDNAQGKTNLLEAIYIGTAANTFRTNKLSEIINWKNENSRINYIFNTAEGSFAVFFELNTYGKKLIKLNGKKLNSNEHLPYPTAIVFTPDDLEIIKGAPARRRKYIDFELGLLDYSYHYYYRQYQRALFERNNLLRQIRVKKIDENLLEIWNHQLIDTGSKLIYKRLQLLKKLVPSLRELYFHLTGGKEKLEVRYLSSVKITLNMEHQQITELFTREIASIREKECHRGQSLKGPHRDEIVFYIDNNDARQYGSRGQQRTIVLALKIALLDLWKKETGEYPILLLDDVLQELDKNRREYLFKKVNGQVQTFLTTSSEWESEWFDPGSGKIIKVHGGKLNQGE